MKSFLPTVLRCAADSIYQGLNRTLSPIIYEGGKVSVACIQVTVKSGSALFIPEGTFHEVRSSPGGWMFPLVATHERTTRELLVFSF